MDTTRFLSLGIAICFGLAAVMAFIALVCTLAGSRWDWEKEKPEVVIALSLLSIAFGILAIFLQGL